MSAPNTVIASQTFLDSVWELRAVLPAHGGRSLLFPVTSLVVSLSEYWPIWSTGSANGPRRSISGTIVMPPAADDDEQRRRELLLLYGMSPVDDWFCPCAPFDVEICKDGRRAILRQLHLIRERDPRNPQSYIARRWECDHAIGAFS